MLIPIDHGGLDLFEVEGGCGHQDFVAQISATLDTGWQGAAAQQRLRWLLRFGVG